MAEVENALAGNFFLTLIFPAVLSPSENLTALILTVFHFRTVLMFTSGRKRKGK